MVVTQQSQRKGVQLITPCYPILSFISFFSFSLSSRFFLSFISFSLSLSLSLSWLKWMMQEKLHSLSFLLSLPLFLFLLSHWKTFILMEIKHELSSWTWSLICTWSDFQSSRTNFESLIERDLFILLFWNIFYSDLFIEIFLISWSNVTNRIWYNLSFQYLRLRRSREREKEFRVRDSESERR